MQTRNHHAHVVKNKRWQSICWLGGNDAHARLERTSGMRRKSKKIPEIPSTAICSQRVTVTWSWSVEVAAKLAPTTLSWTTGVAVKIASIPTRKKKAVRCQIDLQLNDQATTIKFQLPSPSVEVTMPSIPIWKNSYLKELYTMQYIERNDLNLTWRQICNLLSSRPPRMLHYSNAKKRLKNNFKF